MKNQRNLPEIMNLFFCLLSASKGKTKTLLIKLQFQLKKEFLSIICFIFLNIIYKCPSLVGFLFSEYRDLGSFYLVSPHSFSPKIKKIKKKINTISLNLKKEKILNFFLQFPDLHNYISRKSSKLQTCYDKSFDKLI